MHVHARDVQVWPIGQALQIFANSKVCPGLFQSQVKMSSSVNSMSFISALPRPLILDDKRDEKREEIATWPKTQQGRLSHDSITFLNYSVTSENIGLICRDLTLPFEYLKFFANSKPMDIADSDPITSFCSKQVFSKIAKLTDIKLQILHRTEKAQSLTNMPSMLGKALEGVSFDSFLELLPTFVDVLHSWISGIQKICEGRRSRFKKFYATPHKKVFDFEKLTNELARIFIEGFDHFGRPNFADLSYYGFQNFLDRNSIPYAGPYKTCFNGQNHVSVFVLGKVNCLRFFNNNNPLFGIFEYEETAQTKNYENLPTWFLDPPAINNFAINRVISNFDRMSFV